MMAGAVVCDGCAPATLANAFVRIAPFSRAQEPITSCTDS